MPSLILTRALEHLMHEISDPGEVFGGAKSAFALSLIILLFCHACRGYNRDSVSALCSVHRNFDSHTVCMPVKINAVLNHGHEINLYSYILTEFFLIQSRSNHLRQDGGPCFEIPPWQLQPVELENHLELLRDRLGGNVTRKMGASQLDLANRYKGQEINQDI